MMDLSIWQERQKQLDKVKREADRLRGILDAYLEDLQKEFNCSSFKEAEQLKEKLQQQEEKSRIKAEQAWNMWNEKYGEKL